MTLNGAMPCSYSYRDRSQYEFAMSGLDDYPRATRFNLRDEIHLDLQTQMAEFTLLMGTYSHAMQNSTSTLYYKDQVECIFGALNDKSFSEVLGRHADYVGVQHLPKDHGCEVVEWRQDLKCGKSWLSLI